MGWVRLARCLVQTPLAIPNCRGAAWRPSGGSEVRVAATLGRVAALSRRPFGREFDGTRLDDDRRFGDLPRLVDTVLHAATAHACQWSPAGPWLDVARFAALAYEPFLMKLLGVCEPGAAEILSLPKERIDIPRLHRRLARAGRIPCAGPEIFNEDFPWDDPGPWVDRPVLDNLYRALQGARLPAGHATPRWSQLECQELVVYFTAVVTALVEHNEAILSKAGIEPELDLVQGDTYGAAGLDNSTIGYLQKWVRRRDRLHVELRGDLETDALRGADEDDRDLDADEQRDFERVFGERQQGAGEAPAGEGPDRLARAGRPTRFDTVRSALRAWPRLLLVGEAGAGKTHTLEHLRAELAGDCLADPGAPCPVLVNLPHWTARDPDFGAFLERRRQEEGCDGLAHFRLVLLLDGLNELPDEGFEERVTSLCEWLTAHGDVRAVLASRPATAVEIVHLDMAWLQLVPFDDERIFRYAARFLHEEDALPGGEDRARELMRAIRAGRRAAIDPLGLVRNPFLLNATCKAFREEHQKQLPRSRGRLLQWLAGRMLKRKREGSRAEVERAVDAVIEPLSRLAWGMGRTSLVTPERANRLIGPDGGEALEAAIASEVLRVTRTERREDLLEFRHQLFQDYFAAEHLVRHPDALASILKVPRFLRGGERRTQPLDEVFLIAAGLAGDATLLERAADVDPWLATAAMEEAAPCLDRNWREVLARTLLARLVADDEASRGASAQALARLGAVGVLVLREALQGGEDHVRRRAAEALARLDAAGACGALGLALLDGYKYARRAAERRISALAENPARFLATHLPALRDAAAERWNEVAPALRSLLIEYGHDAVVSAATRQGFLRGFTEDGFGQLIAPAQDEPAGQATLEEERESQVDDASWFGRLEWLDRVSPRNAAWQRVWQLAWDAQPGDPELLVRALKWLVTAPGHGSWSWCWRALRAATPADPELERIAGGWLGANPSHPAWQYVWSDLWRSRPGDPALRSLALRWLRGHPEHPSWAYAWAELMDEPAPHPDLQRLATDWLGAAEPGTEAWCFVFSRVRARVTGEGLAGRLRGWLEETERNRLAWGSVWLVAHIEGLDDLAFAWLARMVPPAYAWELVWERLATAHPGDDRLGTLAKSWLRRAPHQHWSWTHLWHVQWQRNPADPALVELATSWLREVGEHPAWGFVWLHLWRLRPTPELAILARGWLATTLFRHKSWGNVWLELSHDPELIELALTWVEDVQPGHPSWQRVWFRLLEHAPDHRERLLARGCRWLAEAGGHFHWAFAWERLRQEMPEDDALFVQGRAWLAAATPAQLSWGTVWEGLWRRHPGDPGLEATALRWLEATGSEITWPLVWSLLWDAAPSPTLTRLGTQWLGAGGPVSPGRNDVLLRLGRPLPDSSQLERELRGVRHADGRWPYVWLEAWNHSPVRSRALVDAGLAWLVSSDRYKRWSSIWLRLWPSGEDRVRLRGLGRAWLQKHPLGRRARDVAAALVEPD